ncbi:MAG: threonine--tRNA ligase [Myxococcota bacterium]|nr:threonine--tRNA ligase [Myxococcota bacterium]
MSEIAVRLPDGRTLAMPSGSTVLAVAQEIGAGLARAALAGRIDGRLVDLRLPLEADVALEIVTARDADGGEVIRHSAEHVMADAVKRLFPDVQIDVGRSDHSEKYQYDFRIGRPFTPEDLERIEDEMRRILAEKAPFEREVVTREEARTRLAAAGEELKIARLDDIPEGEPITLFRHGGFVDLCRGPHVQRTDQIGAVKLLEVAGAYWKGDERNEMLQRIYGTAFAKKAELAEYLERIEQAKQRDHRRLGAQLDLFHVDPVSPGSPFYHPKGVALYNGLVDYVRGLYPRYGFDEVITPQIYRAELYKTSGHYDLFREDMFRFEGDEGEELFVKPMNCPGHCHFYRSTKRSYRDLPLRFAEFTRLHRNERSGTLHGLTRVRSLAQDDAHVYCEPDQVEGEIHAFFAMMREIYDALGLDQVEVYVSTRPDEFIGDPADWDRAEQALIRAVEDAGYPCGIKPGEGAFYAPKVECDFRDVLGRSWTLGTVQVDMAQPGRFGLRYVGRDGQEHEPAMLHRAVLGSLERFIAIYLEHTGGDFPLWLAPVQVVVLPIAERHVDYGRKVHRALQSRGVRAELDDRNEKLGFKIREAETQKLPVMVVIGDQEVANGTVTPRRRHAKPDGESVSLDAFVDDLVATIAERRA